MEPSSLHKTPTASFKDDVSGVYKQIIQYRAKINLTTNDFDTPWIKSRLGVASIILTLIIAGLFGALHLLPPTVWGDTEERVRLVVQLIVLCAYLIAGGIAAAHFISLKRMFKDLTGQMVGTLEDASKDEISLFSGLDSYSVASIQYVDGGQLRCRNNLVEMQGQVLHRARLML